MLYRAVDDDSMTDSLEIVRLRYAEELAEVGSWSWNFETNEVVWSNNLRRLLGVDPETPASFDLYLSLVDVEYRSEGIRIASNALERGKSYMTESWMNTQDNRRIFARAKGTPIQVDGHTYAVGVVQDITEDYELRERLKKTVDIMQGVIEMTQEVVRVTGERPVRAN